MLHAASSDRVDLPRGSNDDLNYIGIDPRRSDQWKIQTLWGSNDHCYLQL
jgi:hypothetical protein